MSEAMKQDHPGILPKVSIGMPVFNGEPFIREALDSLLAQTFTDFELIISDNGSTDGTEAICREYAGCDARIRYMRQPENRGPIANFKFVLDEARCEYFMWAAHDDLWHREFIRKCLSRLEQDKTIILAFSNYWVTSRIYPYLKMRHFPDMAFLSSDDPFIRVSKFILLREQSYKANIIYGLWKKKFAKQMVNAFKDIDDRFVYLGLDIAQLVYTLALFKAYQIPETLFFKTYKRFPPGHITNLIFNIFICQIKGKAGEQHYNKCICDHLQLLQESLRRTGIMEDRFRDIMQTKYRDMIKCYGIRSAFREIAISLKAGVI